jgi:hypothetical protein
MAVAAKIVTKEIRLIQGQANLLMDFSSAVLAAIAGTGGGKTILIYWWLHSRMEAFPGNTWGLAEPTYNMLSKIILESSDPDRPSLIQYFKSIGHHPEYHAVDKILFTDFGKVYLGSADNADSMQGAAVKGYALDEAGLMGILALETARQRCAMLNGQLLLATTPYNLGWLLTEIVQKNGTNGIHVESWRSIDRPGFPKETYDRERKTLPPWRFAMLYDARFERPAGVIYSAFNQDVCVIDRFPIPKSWLIYAGHDFGPDNPAALFYAQDPATGQFYLFAEYVPGPGTAVNERVEAFKRITDGYNVVFRAGGAPAEEETRQLYNAHGWVISKPKIGHVEPQIDKVIGMHQLNKIMVFRDMRGYLDEKMTFSRVLDDQNKPTEKIDNEARYHRMAAERYLLSDFTPETVYHGVPSAAVSYI